MRSVGLPCDDTVHLVLWDLLQDQCTFCVYASVPQTDWRLIGDVVQPGCAVSSAGAPALRCPGLRYPSGEIDKPHGNHREGHPEHHGACVPRPGAGRGDGLHFTCESLFLQHTEEIRRGSSGPCCLSVIVHDCRPSPSPPSAWPWLVGSRSRPRASAGPSPSSS